MSSRAESVFPNYLIVEGGAGKSIKDHRPRLCELTQKEKQLPAVTCEGLAGQGSASSRPPPFSPSNSPAAADQSRGQHSPLQSVLPTPHPPKAHQDPPTFGGGCEGPGRREGEKDAPLQLLSISLLEQLTANTDSPPFSGHMITGTSK